MLSQGIDIEDVEPLVDIFNALGNQQEKVRVYENIEAYIGDENFEFSVWQIERDKVNFEWYNGGSQEREKYISLIDIVDENKREKRPITDAHEKIEIMIPIVSREQVEGFLCTHTKMKSEEVNKRVYLSVHILSFVFEYYRLIEQAKGSGVIDPITGLYNERHFHLQASMDIQKVERFKKPLTSVGIKIKGFDDIVSKSGYEGGEKILRFVSQILEEASRKTDMPARLSGEVFGVSLYETNREGAEIYLERLQRIFANTPFVSDDMEVTIGIDSRIVEYEKELTVEEMVSRTKDL